MRTNRNIAARAGRWSASHRKTAIFGWLAFVVLAVFIGGAIGTKNLNSADAGTGESGRGDHILATSYKRDHQENILVQSRTGSSRDAEFKAGVNDVVHRLRATGKVVGIRSPFSKAGASQISRDGRSAFVVAAVKGSKNDTALDKTDSVQPLLDATAAAQRAHPGLRIDEIGDYSAAKAFEESLSKDFQRATTLSLPITLAIMVIAFGALVAAGIPVLLAITGVMATVSLIAIPSQISPVDQSIAEVVLLVGMAVGVDYSLFYLRREREERASGKDPEAALEAAAATSGRSVLISGVTVMAAMAGMYLTGDKTFSSFATGTIMVVAIAMIGSITVLPALLSKLGDRVEKGRIPGLHRERARDSRLWGWIVDRVMRRPLLTGGLAAAALVVLALPAFGMHTGAPGADDLPKNVAIMKTYERVQTAFPGGPLPSQVVISGRDVTAAPVVSAIK